MSKAIMCDRCGKFERVGIWDGVSPQRQWRALERDICLDGDISKCLCPECGDDYDKFMAEKKS